MRAAGCALFICLALVWVSETAAREEIGAVKARIRSWQKAWQERDVDRYRAHYHPAFRSGDLDLKAWIEKKRSLFSQAGPLQVEIFGISICMEGRHAVARFIQRYRNAAFADVGEKTLTFEAMDGRWQIISEVWQPYTADLPLPEQRRTPAAPSAPSAPARLPAGSPTFGTGVHYIAGDNGSERVYIRLSTFFIPRIFNLAGDRPRIVIDIDNVDRWQADPAITVGGPLIRQIRSFLHHKERRLRVVLDLESSENYTIGQTYFHAQNIYCVEVAKR